MFKQSSVLLLVVAAWVTGCEAPPSNPLSSAISLGVRYSLMIPDSGVLQLHNSSESTLFNVAIHYFDQDTQEEKAYSVGTMFPGSSEEIGVLESGWPVEANQIITLSATDFDSVSYYFVKNQAGQIVYTDSYAKKKIAQIADLIESALK